MKRIWIWVGIGVGLVVSLLGFGQWAGMSPGSTDAQWTDPLPNYAVRMGYSSFYSDRGGWAFPGWHRHWLDRNPPDPDGPVLIDQLHATKQPIYRKLEMTTYGYTKMHGFHRAFEPLRKANVPLKKLKQRWSGETLGGASAVFLNLVSGDNPAIRWSEAVAMDQFVRAGGGLVIITDHTNCYFHAEMLKPLTDLLGVELLPVTATDSGTGYRLSPSSVSWIRAEPNATEHPVTEGVNAFGMTTAGSMALPEGSPFQVLATTSKDGWPDAWLPYKKDDSAGFTGNLERDDDEPKGGMPLVAAAEIGKGRVVVLADQNAFGSCLIGFEDTARLFTNAMAWASKREIPVQVRQQRSVTTLTAPHKILCTAAADFAYRTLQVQAARIGVTSGVDEFCSTGPAGASDGLLLLPGPRRPDLADLLGTGREVAVIVDPKTGIGRQALEHVGLTWGKRAKTASETLVWKTTLYGPDHPLLEDAPTTEQISVRPVHVEGTFDTIAEDGEGRPVLISVAGPEGRVTFLLDADLLRNDVLGGERADPSKGDAAQQAGHRLAFRLLWRLFEHAGG